jgi:hypothetical protein
MPMGKIAASRLQPAEQPVGCRVGTGSGRSCPALTADRGAVAVAQLDDSPPAGGDEQVR